MSRERERQQGVDSEFQRNRVRIRLLRAKQSPEDLAALNASNIERMKEARAKQSHEELAASQASNRERMQLYREVNPRANLADNF